MNCKLLLSGLLCAVLLSGCSSPQKGKWVDVNPPISTVTHSGGGNETSKK